MIPGSGSQTLRRKDLETNGYLGVPEMVELLRDGKGMMPPFQGKYLPPFAKLTDEEIEQVAIYVLKEAEVDWYIR